MPDVIRVVRAIATNQVARFAPGAYVRLTGQTGRGGENETSGDIADYFRRSFDEYFRRLGVAAGEIDAFLAGKTLLEYGPGDLPAVAALMVAHGADKVYCVDRFPLVRIDSRNARVLEGIAAGLAPAPRARFDAARVEPARPAAGFQVRRIEYLVLPNGTSGLSGVVDLVFSRAVLEHVNDLSATLEDMVRAMRPGATAIHLVDLASHGLHQHNPLDFLTWKPRLWDLMYSAKGVPNRWRVDRYRRILAHLPVDVIQLEPTKRADPDHIRSIRPRLDPAFRDLPDEDLAWLGFWLVFRKRVG